MKIQIENFGPIFKSKFHDNTYVKFHLYIEDDKNISFAKNVFEVSKQEKGSRVEWRLVLENVQNK